jgi:hypothetical protein
LLIVLSWITITPGSVGWITPCQIRSPASVTTNDGTPISATNEPWKAPIAVVQERDQDAEPAREVGAGRELRAARRPRRRSPLTNAIERSISPISRTKTTP